MKLAVYAGTFDPVTNGHLDIVSRALNVFDRLIIAVGDNTAKSVMFSAAERANLLTLSLKENGIFQAPAGDRLQVTQFNGLLVDYVRSVGSRIIVRGLRAVSDYEWEAQMALLNREIAADIDTVFFMTSTGSAFISSSVVKEIARHGGDVSSLVPPCVVSALKSGFKK
jgi:pantetheine-phosphate adenylyltransferase